MKDSDYGPGMDHTGTVNYRLPPRGVSGGKPPKGMRNWDCREDGHEDPDNSGMCIHCAFILDPEPGEDPNAYRRRKGLPDMPTD